MNYGNIKDCDIANGSGVRISVFVSGCTNHCTGCFQPKTWDFNYGEPFTEETEEKILKMLDHEYIDGLTLLGGEPFEPDNQRVLVNLLRKVRSLLPEKNVWAFSGFTLEQMQREGEHCRTEVTDDMLDMIDVLVDGRFEEAKKDITLKFRGSSNQRIIDLNKWRESGKIEDWIDETDAIM